MLGLDGYTYKEALEEVQGPACIVQDANLWDVSSAPTIVMTQRGARKEFQESLRAKGVEVVQFDFLTPEAVAAYCQERGFLQVPSSCQPYLAL